MPTNVQYNRNFKPQRGGISTQVVGLRGEPRGRRQANSPAQLHPNSIRSRRDNGMEELDDSQSPKRRKLTGSSQHLAGMNQESAIDVDDDNKEVLIQTVDDLPPELRRMSQLSRQSARSGVAREFGQSTEFNHVDDMGQSFKRNRKSFSQNDRDSIASAHMARTINNRIANSSRDSFHSRPPSGEKTKRPLPAAYSKLNGYPGAQNVPLHVRTSDDEDDAIDFVSPNADIPCPHGNKSAMVEVLTNGAPQRPSAQARRTNQFRNRSENVSGSFEILDQPDELADNNTEYKIKGASAAKQQSRSGAVNRTRSRNDAGPARQTNSSLTDASAAVPQHKAIAKIGWELSEISSPSVHCAKELFLRKGTFSAYSVEDNGIRLFSINSRDFRSIETSEDGNRLIVTCKSTWDQNDSDDAPFLLLAFKTNPDMGGFVKDIVDVSNHRITVIYKERSVCCPPFITKCCLTSFRPWINSIYDRTLEKMMRRGNSAKDAPEQVKLRQNQVAEQEQAPQIAQEPPKRSKFSRSIDLDVETHTTRPSTRLGRESPLRIAKSSAPQGQQEIFDLTDETVERTDEMKNTELQRPKTSGTAVQRLASFRENKLPKKPARFQSRLCFIHPGNEEKSAEVDVEMAEQDAADISTDIAILNDHDAIKADDGLRRSLRRTRSTRSFAEPESPTSTRPVEKVDLGRPWEYSISYPLGGQQPAHIEFVDLNRLNSDEMLNDSLIDFYARWLREQYPSQAARIYTFSTYFHTRLSQEGYDSVSRWTKKIDLFIYDYVLIPVNYGLHWYLAIICNLPNIKRKLAGASEDDPIEDADLDRKTQPHTAADKDPHAAVEERGVRTSKSPHAEVSSPIEEASHKPEPGSATKQGGKRKFIPPGRRIDPSEPTIIFLDPMGISRQSRLLKKYIADEGKAKRDMNIDVKEIKGMNAGGIAQQDNSTDCGLYIILYMAMFMRDPDGFVGSILRKELNEKSDWDVNSSRMRADFRNLLQDIYKEQEPELAKLIKGKKKKKPEGQQPPTVAAPPKPPGPSPPKDLQPTIQVSRSASPVKTVAPSAPIARSALPVDGRNESSDAVKLSREFFSKLKEQGNSEDKTDVTMIDAHHSNQSELKSTESRDPEDLALDQADLDEVGDEPSQSSPQTPPTENAKRRTSPATPSREIPETPPRETEDGAAARTSSPTKRKRGNSSQTEDPMEVLSQGVL